MRSHKSAIWFSGIICILVLASSASAGQVDLSTWTAESYDSVAGFNDGIWTVSGSGDSVNQSINGQPTFFFSDFNAMGKKVEGTIRSDGGDDDFIGFALGFQSGDSSNSSADYLLVSWKRGTQWYDFNSQSTSPGSTALAGLSVSRVTGIPNADEFWGHWNDAGHTAGGVQELQRATNLGSTGWVIGTSYDFTFDFGPTDLEVFVNGTKELDITGSFANGRMAFYNFSQADVTYSAFEEDSGTFPVVPLPAPVFMGLIGLGLVHVVRRRMFRR